MSDNRPIAYVEDGSTYYRASGAGSCLLAVVAAKAGYKPERNAKTEGILMSAAKEGNLHEGAIIDELIETYGWKVWGDQDLVELKILPKVFIRGHTDGMCKPKRARNTRLLEVKTMSKDRFKKWMSLGDTPRERLLSDEFLKYAWQISVYMHATGLPAMYVVKNRDSGVLDIGEIELPPIGLKEIRRKIIQAEMYSKKGTLPNCEAASGEKWFCPYPYLHDLDSSFGDEPENEADPIDSVTEVLIAGLAEKYADLKKQVALLKPLDEERKAIGKKIVAAMGGRGSTEKIVAGQWLVTRQDRVSVSLIKERHAAGLNVSMDEYTKAADKAKNESKFEIVTVKKVGDK